MSVYIELLYRAAQSPLGIEVKGTDATRLREKLYAARRDAGNPEFESFTFTPGRIDPLHTIWIIKRGPDG